MVLLYEPLANPQRMKTKKYIAECYEILGITRETPPEEIKRAFKKIIMHHHPDRKEDHEKEGYEEASKIYIEAYKTVTDTQFMARVAAFESGEIGKNQECYCGSEKKYKQCCGK
jgi:DnaJ-class molecular chaperone